MSLEADAFRGLVGMLAEAWNSKNGFHTGMASMRQQLTFAHGSISAGYANPRRRIVGCAAFSPASGAPDFVMLSIIDGASEPVSWTDTAGGGVETV